MCGHFFAAQNLPRKCLSKPKAPFESILIFIYFCQSVGNPFPVKKIFFYFEQIKLVFRSLIHFWETKVFQKSNYKELWICIFFKELDPLSITNNLNNTTNAIFRIYQSWNNFAERMLVLLSTLSENPLIYPIQVNQIISNFFFQNGRSL